MCEKACYLVKAIRQAVLAYIYIAKKCSKESFEIKKYYKKEKNTITHSYINHIHLWVVNTLEQLEDRKWILVEFDAKVCK